MKKHKQSNLGKVPQKICNILASIFEELIPKLTLQINVVKGEERMECLIQKKKLSLKELKKHNRLLREASQGAVKEKQ